MNRTASGIVLSEFVLSGDPLYLYEWSPGQAALTTTYVFQSTEFKMQFAFSNESLGVFPFCLEAEFHPNMCMMSEMGSRV